MLIAGIDEVGRGPLAGPVVTACVIFEAGYHHPEITDSKMVAPKKRRELCGIIKQHCVAWSIVAVGHERIANLNIRGATKLGMELALWRAATKARPDLVLIDGNMEITTDLVQRTVVKGDSLHIEIGAASILAKVYRDDLMVVLDTKYPGYGLSGHAGYPTENHRRAIATIGPSRIHRREFRGVKEFWPPRPPHEPLQTAA